MFVFPANNEGYRKRKRVLRACEQCKRRRQRCDFPLGSVRCEPCRKADIMCSLAPEFVLMEKESRLDNLAQQNLSSVNPSRLVNQTDLDNVGSSGHSNIALSQGAQMGQIGQPQIGPTTNTEQVELQTPSSTVLSGSVGSGFPVPRISPTPPPPPRPTLTKRSSSASSINTLNGAGLSHSPTAQQVQDITVTLNKASSLFTTSSNSLLPSTSLGPITSGVGGPATQISSPPATTTTQSFFKPLKLTADIPRRPGMGSRSSSFTHSHVNSSSATSSQIRKQQGISQSHKRTGSHSPGLTNKTAFLSQNLSNNNRQQQPLNDTKNNNNNNNTGNNNSPSYNPTVDRESIGVWVKGVTSQQRLDPHLHTYLSSISAFSMPLRPDREALIRIYCESIDKILPLLDKEQFVKLHNVGQAPTLLLHAVLLAAARHPRAAQHLGHESTRQFCASTAAKIRALLYAEVEQDRLTLVRIYALLSLHSEGPDGLENSCSDLQKSLHYATSLGIHHDRPFIDKDKLRKLWWSIWCMDRISACVNAKPLIINNEDIGLPPITSEEHSQLARLKCACDKLEKVIYLYRPGFSKGSEPCIVPEEVDRLFMGDDTIDPLNAIHALLHHAAVILAHKRVSSGEEDMLQEETVVTEVAGLRNQQHQSEHRHNNQQQRMPHSTSQPLSPQAIKTMSTPLTMILAQEKQKSDAMASDDTFVKSFDDFLTTTTSTSENERSDRANSTGAGAGGELYSSPESDWSITDARLLSAAGSVLRILRNSKDLPPLPLIPYCVSLTLTVFLRTFPRVDSETGFSWRDSCTALESMADRWWVAGAMGTMGWNVFKSLETDARKQQEKEAEQQQVAIQPDYMDTGGVPMEEQYLDMFSNLPNQTSFIDEALAFDDFANVDAWFQEKR